jgi:N-methylhydantoinase A
MGPQSAGSEPGPACYGKGGELPTTTDANLVLGYLSPKGLVGGRLELDQDKASNAIKSKIADPLDLTLERAAYGMFTIVNNNMVNGIRRVSVERGYDPRDFVLMGAGGATGAHITALANEIGINRILISKLASGLCAYGQIISDVKYNFMAPAPYRLDSENVANKLQGLFDKLEHKGNDQLAKDGFSEKDIHITRTLDMRYTGQVHECTVEVDAFDITGASLKALEEAFHARHEELYMYSERHSAIEVVNVESTIIGKIDRPERMKQAKGSGADNAKTGTRQVVFSSDGARIETPIYDGSKLGAGDHIEGPAVLEEETTTIVLDPQWKLTLSDSAVYELVKKN